MYVITNISNAGAIPETRRTREGAIYRAWTIIMGLPAMRVRIENRVTGETIEGERIADLAATLSSSGPFE